MHRVTSYREAVNQSSSIKVVSILEGGLPFGNVQPISLEIYAKDKVHIVGKMVLENRLY